MAGLSKHQNHLITRLGLAYCGNIVDSYWYMVMKRLMVLCARFRAGDEVRS